GKIQPEVRVVTLEFLCPDQSRVGIFFLLKRDIDFEQHLVAGEVLGIDLYRFLGVFQRQVRLFKLVEIEVRKIEVSQRFIWTGQGEILEYIDSVSDISAFCVIMRYPDCKARIPTRIEL